MLRHNNRRRNSTVGRIRLPPVYVLMSVGKKNICFKTCFIPKRQRRERDQDVVACHLNIIVFLYLNNDFLSVSTCTTSRNRLFHTRNTQCFSLIRLKHRFLIHSLFSETRVHFDKFGFSGIVRIISNSIQLLSRLWRWYLPMYTQDQTCCIWQTNVIQNVTSILCFLSEVLCVHSNTASWMDSSLFFDDLMTVRMCLYRGVAFSILSPNRMHERLPPSSFVTVEHFLLLFALY